MGCTATGRRAFLEALPGLAALASVPAAAEPATLLGAWSGGVSGTGATVKALAALPGVPVELVLHDEAGEVARTEATADALGAAAFALDGLRERTRYRYEVRAPAGSALAGAFRTFRDGPHSFRVLFASCAATGSRSPVFEAMRRRGADLFVHMGDLHYEDVARDEPALFRRAYLAAHASPTQSALLRSLPLVYVWDDHDFGPNDSDRRSPSRRAALAAYRSLVPHYALDPDESATIHQAFDVGRVRFLVSDVRSARSPRGLPLGERTMLGARQLEWLERELDGARQAALVVWVNPVPWITRRDESTREGWAPYAVERRRIADRIAGLALERRLVMLSGDAHMLAFDDGTHSQYAERPGAAARGFAVAHAAPMDRRPTRKGGPYSQGEAARNGQYGVLDVRDDGGRIAITLQGMRGDEPVPGMRLELEV